MIQFERKTRGDLEAALRREWLETNGLGGFASSTIIGLNTRRYHGLLVAATTPVGRLVLLSKLEETLVIDGKRFDLSANRYRGVVHPHGFCYLKKFRLAPFPVFTYEAEGIAIEKSVFMTHGENSTVIHYELKKENNRRESPKNVGLDIRPLIAFRDYHGTTHENDAISPEVQERSGLATVTPYQGLPTLHLAHNAIELCKTGDWYRNYCWPDFACSLRPEPVHQRHTALKSKDRTRQSNNSCIRP
jgi:predicted glycogen debranching enzyme